VLSAWSFYIATLTVYFGVNVLSAISLNLQFGYAGVVNFGYILFQAIGAYAAAVVVLGPSAGSFQKYVFGATLPFPLPLVVATLAGALLSLVLGLFSLRRIRRSFRPTCPCLRRRPSPGFRRHTTRSRSREWCGHDRHHLIG